MEVKYSPSGKAGGFPVHVIFKVVPPSLRLGKNIPPRRISTVQVPAQAFYSLRVVKAAKLWKKATALNKTQASQLPHSI